MQQCRPRRVPEKALAAATAPGAAGRGLNLAHACAPARVLSPAGLADVPSAPVTVVLLLEVTLVRHYNFFVKMIKLENIM